MFISSIPLEEIRVGDHFYAAIPVKSKYVDKKRMVKRCKLVEVCGNIFRVSTRTNGELIPILKDQIVGTAWGER